MSSLIIVIGGISLVVYFVCFFIVFKLAGTETTEKYMATFTGGNKLRNFLGSIVIVSAFFVSNLYLASAVFIVGALLLSWETYRQHSIMQNSDFDPMFEKRLRYINFLPAIATILLFAGKILRCVNT